MARGSGTARDLALLRNRRIQQLEGIIKSQQCTIASQQRILEERFNSRIRIDDTCRVGCQTALWGAVLTTEDPTNLDMWPNHDSVRHPDRQVNLRVRISRRDDDRTTPGDGGDSSGRGDGEARPGRGDGGASSGLGDGGASGRKRARSPENLIDVTVRAAKSDHFVLVASEREISDIQFLRTRALDCQGRPILSPIVRPIGERRRLTR